MAPNLSFLFLAYQQTLQVHDANYINEQMWIRYSDAESPGYNAFMCIMHALETHHDLSQFQQEVDQIQIYMGERSVDVDLVYYARHMEDTLQDIREGLPLHPFLEW